jgi:hypothetical protein
MSRGVPIWGAHAPRVLVSEPSPKHAFKVRDREGAIASTRGRVRSPIP